MMLIHSICMAFIGFGRFKKVDIVIRLIAAIDLKVKGILFFNRINFLVRVLQGKHINPGLHTKRSMLQLL